MIGALDFESKDGYLASLIHADHKEEHYNILDIKSYPMVKNDENENVLMETRMYLSP